VDVGRLRDARARVLERIAEACQRVGRDPAGVTLVAVTKTVSPESIRSAIQAGLTIFGENRVQEAESKIGQVPGARWHLVGPLQSNKARRAVTVFDVVESVDSVALATRLDRLVAETRPGFRLPIMLQVNVDRDATKAGLDPDAVGPAMDEVQGMASLDVRGLMTVGRLVAAAEEARPTFGALRALSEALRATHRQLGPDLSMGMTDDFEVAVEEGATILRIGRALFGERP
jgi:pyridoxal phosphate enzyme (YggS family)